MTNLPSNKKGEYQVYLVIKDAQGIPVKVANPINVTIKPDTGGKSEPIIAQQAIKANLFDQNRLQFKINPEEKNLHQGYYRATIYTDWGLLGAAQFQLR